MNRPVLRMGVLSMLSSACNWGCQCIPARGNARVGSVLSLLWFPPDLRGSGCLRSTGTLANCVHHSLAARCLQEAILCPLGDFCVCIDFNADLVMAQATFELSLRSKKEKNKTGHIFISFFFLNPKQRAHYFLFKTTKFSSKTHLICVWYGRCWYPLPTAVTYTHSCIANCLPSNELTEISALLHMLGFAGCISASLLFILQKPFSVPAVIFRNWQVGFCKLIKFILNMDVTLHQKTMKRQEIRSRTYPSLCQISAQRRKR